LVRFEKQFSDVTCGYKTCSLLSFPPDLLRVFRPQNEDPRVVVFTPEVCNLDPGIPRPCRAESRGKVHTTDLIMKEIAILPG
jgi:hypothetical protein